MHAGDHSCPSSSAWRRLTTPYAAVEWSLIRRLYHSGLQRRVVVPQGCVEQLRVEYCVITNARRLPEKVRKGVPNAWVESVARKRRDAKSRDSRARLAVRLLVNHILPGLRCTNSGEELMKVFTFAPHRVAKDSRRTVRSYKEGIGASFSNSPENS